MGATRKKSGAGGRGSGTTRQQRATTTATKKSGAGGRGSGTTRQQRATTTATKKASKKATKKAARKTTARKPATKTRARASGALTEYQRKRDFSRTAEPSGSETKPRRTPGGNAAPLQFVIQKHAASHLHFDFRLELDGVMKSWAVPKGPSMHTGVRRLAMEVEDHPMSYNSFEGTIPKGQYGGGTVMLWDRGHYLPADGDPASLRKGLRKGRLDIVMLGERLKGGFTLVRSSRNDGKPQWLLFKRSDEYADPRGDPVDKAVTSVVSGRTMDEIAEGDEVWHSNRK